jgi:hypothetical protein
MKLQAARRDTLISNGRTNQHSQVYITPTYETIYVGVYYFWKLNLYPSVCEIMEQVFGNKVLRNRSQATRDEVGEKWWMNSMNFAAHQVLSRQSYPEYYDRLNLGREERK